MTLTDLFGHLGAPLSHHRWSWGAVRPEDGAVFVRVWQDEQRRIDGAWFTQVTYCGFSNDNPSNLLGYMERLKHVELVRDGAPSYMVMCKARDIRASTRELADGCSEPLKGTHLADTAWNRPAHGPSATLHVVVTSRQLVSRGHVSCVVLFV